MIYLVTGGEQEWKGNRMERAKEGSIWRRKIFGEWRRSRMGKEKEENMRGSKIWGG